MGKVDMGECFKKHPTAHLVTGVGLGLLAGSLFTGLAGQTGMIAGVVLVVLGVGSEFVLGQK